jgi:hypothetical protein
VPGTPESQRRRWADVAVIVAGLLLSGLAIWPPPFVNTQEVGGRFGVWQVYALAGGLTMAGLLLGQRWRALARPLLLAAVLVLAAGLFTTFRDLGPAAALTVILPGLVILVTTPFFGPMPREAESR